jgi:replication-associated recombination protein RarA
MTNDFHLITQKGYDFFEVTSALQKSIRRGKEHEALYWAMELLPRYEFYLWRRLKIISSEDIGIANPQAIILVQILSEQYFELRKRGDMGCLLMVANAILFLCRSKKTRLADHFICAMIQEREQGILRMEIPDYALDMHTRSGKAQRRGLQHFKEEGAKLSPKDMNIEDPYEERSYELEGSKEAKTLSWKKLQNKDKEDANQKLLFE